MGGGGGGGGGPGIPGVPLGSPNPVPISGQKVHFPHPFSNLVSKARFKRRATAVPN